MASDKLKALQAAMAAKAGGGNNFNNYFQFWRAPIDSTSIFRFLPDADESNPFQFFVENLIHELWIDGEKKRVPCLKMHGESSCPICAHSASLYDKAKEAKKIGDVEEEKKWRAEGKKYYRKLSYIAQGIVVESPIEHDANTLVHLIDFGPTIYEIMQAAFQSGDLDNEPYDFYNGYNFRFKKTLKRSPEGDNANYSTSSFAPKPNPIDEDLIAKIDLFDLKNYRQKAITRSEAEQLLEAAISGKPAPAKEAPAQSSSTAAQEDTSTQEAPTSTTTAETTGEAPAKSNSALLSSLRERAKAKAAAAQTEE